MPTSSLVVEKAQQLAAAGHHAEVVEYLGAHAESDLQGSPTLALLYGTAQQRLRRHDVGLRWLHTALDVGRQPDDTPDRPPALKTRGTVQLDHLAIYRTA